MSQHSRNSESIELSFHKNLRRYFVISVAPIELESEVIHMVFEGVDTVAFIELNDSPVGTTNNMFVRYVFDVKNKLKVRN